MSNRSTLAVPSVEHRSRRRFLAAAATLPALPATADARAFAAAAAQTPKHDSVLRFAFHTAETGFDPVQISDIYSRTVAAHIFEAPLRYDYLARPFKLQVATAAAMPEVSPDHTTFTVHIRPGIYFADDPAFDGKPRELTAPDYVYSWKRCYDPRWKSANVTFLLVAKLLGLNEYRDEVLRSKRAFDYDRPLEGLRALDRYTLRIKLAAPNPRFIYYLASPDQFGAVAREVVERYGDAMMEHPVGTGPYRLAQWKRSSRIELERNPAYRDVRWHAEPNADDAAGQAMAARLSGHRLPLADRVQISIIDEDQPRYLSFINAAHDVLWGVPLEYANLILPGGRIAPYLARRGVQLHRLLEPDVSHTVFNMDHPVIGGYTPERVALRRAISLASDIETEIRLARRDQAIPAQGPVMPNTYGYDPAFKSEMSDFDPARARALLDLYGYIDRDGDGWREQPDGTPLVLELATQPDQTSRQFDELWKKNLERIGVRLSLSYGRWPEQLKAARAGKFMIWGVALGADQPDGQGVYIRGYSQFIGGRNFARFNLPAFDRLYERMNTLPDGPERLALFRQADALLIAYAPYKFHVHRITNDLTHRWVDGFRRPPFSLEWCQYVHLQSAADMGGAHT